MITIRPTQLDDGDAVSRVLAAAYGTLLAEDYPEETLRRVVPLISRAKPELLGSGTYLAAVADGEIIAVGGWTPERPGSGEVLPDVGHIRHVACHPDHLRRGAARSILAASLASARARGVIRLECLSTLTAARFYAACGFVAVAECDVAIAGHAFRSVDMRLTFPVTTADTGA